MPEPGPEESDPDAPGPTPDDLRQRLTEREDKRRPAESWSVPVAGRPLTVSGEYEAVLGGIRRRVLLADSPQDDQLLLEQELETEVFYSFGPPLSLFAQIRVGMEEDLLPDTFDAVSAVFVERGELWVYSEDIAGTHFNLDLGRLHFEDERRWWWDEELDAVRLAYERETWEVSLAVATELAPPRSDQGTIDVENQGVLRVLGEVGWDWSANHGVELFVLHARDRSGAFVGQTVRTSREDESDARLTWAGARWMGVSDLGAVGLFGYWLDGAVVEGSERLVAYEPLPGGRSEVVEKRRRHVRGWAVDGGLGWIVPLPWEPRLVAGYAYASGDRSEVVGDDRGFRQTGLQANEAGFGGVERFPHTGILLDPELSNLGVVTAGVGFSLLRSSSLDLVYHYYRLAHPAESLRDARLELELDGRQRELGHGLDLVLALEEWERFEFELIGSAFRAGRAVDGGRGRWSAGGFVAVRYAF